MEREQPIHQEIQGDLLINTIHQLKDATLSVRAGKLGTSTLRNMWQLNNPFTSDSVDLQTVYSRNLMRIFYGHNAASWEGITEAVGKSIQPFIRREGRTIKVNIRDVSRQTTLVAVLKSLFDIEDVDHDRLQYIGGEIHRLTVGKKQFDATASSVDDLPAEFRNAAERLIQDLRKLFKGVDQSSPLAYQLLSISAETTESINPLNLLIPAFEAPWRAVFYTLLALFQDQDEGRSNDIKAVRDQDAAAKPSPRALAVAYESLRLYPPIRRVRRERRVDIELVQRHHLYWGQSATVWDPTRFLDDDNRIKTQLLRPEAAWMPFAVGSMKCPSAGGFSAQLIVVVVSEILKQILPNADETRALNWRLEGPQWQAESSANKPLTAGREEFGAVEVVVESTTVSAR